MQLFIRNITDRPIMFPRKFVSVDSLIIQENYRRYGVGQALMENVHQWVKARDKQNEKSLER